MIDEDEIATGEFEAIELDEDGNLVVPKVTDEWLWAMNDAVAYLEKRIDFRVDRYEAFRPVPDIVRETVESASGMTVAPTVSSLYSVTDGLELEWSREQDGDFVPAGRVHLYGFAEVFGSWLGKLWGEHSESAGEEEVDFTWEIRAFDAGRTDSDYVTVMHTPDVLPTYNLYWHAPQGRTLRLRVDFLEYLQCLTETRGLFGWQYMVCDAKFEEGDEALDHIRECTRLMRELFADVDLSRYTTLDDDE